MSTEVTSKHAEDNEQVEEDIVMLQNRLQILLNENEDAPPLEKLERGDFCVDLLARENLVKAADEKCARIRAQVEKENSARSLVRSRLVQEFFLPMKEPGCAVASLLGKKSVGDLTGVKSVCGGGWTVNSTLVASALPQVARFPVRELSEEEKRRFARVRQMREVELLELEWHARSDSHRSLLILSRTAWSVEALLGGVLANPGRWMVPYLLPSAFRTPRSLAFRSGSCRRRRNGVRTHIHQPVSRLGSVRGGF